MKSDWMIERKPVGERVRYLFYRLKDVSLADSSQNREYFDYEMDYEDLAQIFVDHLNGNE